MQTVARNHFTTVKTEGAILPADLLQRIADGKMDGLQPVDYHLAPGERLNEAIIRAWNRCRGVWETFNEQRRQLPESDSGVSLTRERWLLILFQELGYGRLAFQQRGLELPEDHASIQNRQSSEPARHPISHLWQQTPIHLVSFRQELDRRDPTIKRSPHSLMQEFLNRSDDYLWGFVSNGLMLQILRDNISLTRTAYVEFDLEKMMIGQVYADFTLLWLICHQSRVETLPATSLPTDCWLERWSQQAAEQGTRALDALRKGVQEAIAALGRGFLAHPGSENERLRQKLRNGTLSRDDYFRQLLRLVYRLIFLFVAEDRDLLLLPEADEQTRHRYTTYYSAGRLRRLAEARRGGPHPDLYRSLRQVFFLLRADQMPSVTGYPPLGLPALGSLLFSERSTPALDECDIANTDLLNAIRALAFTVEGQVTRLVDYKNLGTEELGSVYESLLELHPFLNIEAATFTLEVAAGSERKTTGSYYTPSSLINNLLDSALEPVVADRLQVTGGKSQGGVALEEALLSIKVVDPACGSGHFLIAAANRLAAHLARIRTGDVEPSPTARREALRDVVHHCIHGVDINEMAVELCKVGLWMETIDPGKPLGFLERNIQCGNSLIGATPALLRQGIPDEAFTPINGDDNDYCKEWKARNKEERKGQLSMRFEEAPWQRLGDLATAMAKLDRMGDKTLAEVRAQEETYAKMVLSSDYENSHLWADTWCAAFVWQKNNRFDYPITEQTFRKIEHNPFDMMPWMKKEIKRLRDEYQFFHWHLVFPHVFHRHIDKISETAKVVQSNDVTGWTGGFDVVLGNPPWEVIAPEEQEFFAVSAPEIIRLAKRSERLLEIKKLKVTDPDLSKRWQSYRRRKLAEAHFCHYSDNYPLSGKGNLNSYSLFLEKSRLILDFSGYVGLIVPSSIASSSGDSTLFNDLVESHSLISLYDFENRENLFSAVDSRAKFCLITMTSPGQGSTEIRFAFFLHNLTELISSRIYTLSLRDLTLLNPNTKTAATFRSKRDAELVLKIHKQFPVLLNQNKSEELREWQVECKRMVDLSYDSKYFLGADDLIQEDVHLRGDTYTINKQIYLPVLEAKMTQQYDHRAADVIISPTAQIRSAQQQTLSQGEHVNPDRNPNPRFWMPKTKAFRSVPDWYVHNYLLAYTLVTSPTNHRTMLATIVPKRPLGHSLRIIYLRNVNAKLMAAFCGCLNSFVFDYVTRQKIGGINLNPSIVYQLPIPTPERFTHNILEDTIGQAGWIMKHVLELSYTSWILYPFAQDCGYHGPPFRWDEERRFLMRRELDAAYFHLYGIARDDVAYIMDTFPIVRRKDEAAFGEYRTRRVILEIYDEMAEAMRTGQSYQTRLDPPPADPRAAHPWDESYLGPYRGPSTWWQEEVATVKEEKIIEGEKAVTHPPQSAPSVSHSAKEPAPTLQLRSPAPPTKREETMSPPTAHATQYPLLDVAPVPTGPRSRRLKRAMALGRDSSPTATRELVAFLADQDSNIRWLAGSSLVQRANSDVVAAIAAFLEGAEAGRVAVARPEIQRVLGMIAETAESEAVRERAREIRKQSQTSASQE